jgi:hypothetical protein
MIRNYGVCEILGSVFDTPAEKNLAIISAITGTVLLDAQGHFSDAAELNAISPMMYAAPKKLSVPSTIMYS